jgi:hypothetical protein
VILLAHQESEEDILDAIKWLREHDEEAELIGQRARDFVLKYLNREARQCYWKEVLTRSGNEVYGCTALA